MTKYTLRRIRPSKVSMAGYVQYLTVKNGIPEFNAPGNTPSGVGVANLKTWRTEAGARRWMDENKSWIEVMCAIGVIDVVPA